MSLNAAGLRNSLGMSSCRAASEEDRSQCGRKVAERNENRLFPARFVVVWKQEAAGSPPLTGWALIRFLSLGYDLEVVLGLRLGGELLPNFLADSVGHRPVGSETLQNAAQSRIVAGSKRYYLDSLDGQARSPLES